METKIEGKDRLAEPTLQPLKVGDKARAFAGPVGKVKELRKIEVGGKHIGTTVTLEYAHKSNDPRRVNEPILTTGEYELMQVEKI